MLERSDFLSEDECEAIVKQTMENDRSKASQTVNSNFELEQMDFEYLSHLGYEQIPQFLHVPDIQIIFRSIYDMPRLSDAQAQDLLQIFDSDYDGKVSRAEFDRQASWGSAGRMKQRLHETHPEGFTRFSRETRVELSSSIIARILEAIGLPAPREDGDAQEHFGEQPLVVHYGGCSTGEGSSNRSSCGHYTCHHDSAEERGSTLRRAYTVLVPLRDVPVRLGGQTWFPGAIPTRVGTEDQQVAQLKERAHWGEGEWGDLESQCTLNNSCAAGQGLVVPSVRGSALIWTNHDIEHTDEGVDIGGLKWPTLHGGCDVQPGGEKWIMNQWIWKHAVMRECNGAEEQREDDDEDGL